tara:strand:- start:94 stop:204 length:111 start_codon:yes stop_codon:yes gene_type:complete
VISHGGLGFTRLQKISIHLDEMDVPYAVESINYFEE